MTESVGVTEKGFLVFEVNQTLFSWHGFEAFKI